MTKERFIEIAREVGFPEDQIDATWDERPPFIDGDHGRSEESVRLGMLLAIAACKLGIGQEVHDILKAAVDAVEMEEKARKN